MMKKLLLADDSITIQKVVGIIFSTEEYQLEMTDDGDSAFTKALAEIPDLVIADISMPGKDGFELCRAIKSEPSLANTSVLLLPGAFDHFDEVKAGEVCADGWLTKPFESQALLDKVSQLLEAEPVRMAGITVPEAVDVSIADTADEAATGEYQSVNETALGLDDMDELVSPVGAIEEDSPEDIWDSVSFAEEDLKKPNITVSEDSEGEVSFAADIIDPSVAGEVAIEPATNEEVLSAFTAESSTVDLPTAEVESDFVVGVSESGATENLQSEPFEDIAVVNEENVTELGDQVESGSEVISGATTEETESVDFSVYSDAADTSEDSTYFVPTSENDEPLNLADELDESPVETAEESSYSDTEIEKKEPLELSETDVVEQSAEVDIADGESVSFASEPDDDEEDIMELQEEDELDELTPVIPESVAVEESDISLVEAAADGIPEDGEIIDLSDDEIVEDVPIEEEIEEETAAEEGESFQTEDTETDTESVDEIVDLADEEIELVEEVETLSTVDEDENFYFDATAEDSGDVTNRAVGVAVTHFGAETNDDSVTEQVEQQLRELSEEELKEVIAKVAGPMIEKLATEMIEKIAWEVVPDLAEVMISEEIRKIKEGE